MDEERSLPPPAPGPDGDVEVSVAITKKPEPQAIERTPTIKDYIRVFSYATSWDFVAYAAGLLASIGAGVTLPLMNVVFGRFVKEFSNFANLEDMDASSFQDIIDKLALYMLGLFLGRWFLNYVNKFAFRMIGIRLSSAIRLHYLQSLLKQSVHVLDSMPPGHATGTITGTANVLQIGISEKLGVFVEFSSTITAATVVAFTWSWRLALVTSSLILFILVVTGLFLPLVLTRSARQAKAESEATAVASESLSSIRMITACGAERRISDKYAEFVDEAKRHAQSASPLISLMTGILFLGAFGAFGLAFWYGIKLFAQGGLDNVGTIAVVLFSVMMVVFSLERISTPLLAVGKAMVAACEFFVVIDAPRPPTGHLSEPEISSTEDLFFDKVTFAYPSRPDVTVLDQLDLRIEAGKITAIVGPSGSGKSTIVGLLQRWYTLQEQYKMDLVIDPSKQKKKSHIEESDIEGQATGEEAVLGASEARTGAVKLGGSVTICDRPLGDIDMKWWRSQIGLVQQEPFLFNDTIFANVADGLIGSQWENESEEVKRRLVAEACSEAFATEFIDKLPQAYDTIVGDSGAKLSGGQRQRLAIARSIVRKPKILILDEATSAIDVRGERIVQAALDRAAQNRTTITIAHRLSTIRKADRIVVLNKGKVVESGTHESLIIVDGGVYAGLVHAQALSLGDQAEQDVVEQDEADHGLLREKSHARANIGSAESEREDEGENRSIFQGFYIFFFESRNTWGLKATTVIFAAGAGSAIPLQAWLFAQCIDAFKYSSDPTKLESEGQRFGLMYMGLSIGVGVAYFGCYLASTRLASIIRGKYQSQYFDAILHQATSFFDQETHSHGEMTSRAASDPQRLEELMGANMAAIYVATFTLLGGISIAFAFAWKLAFVSTVVVLPVLLAAAYWRFRYELQFEKMNNDVFAESSKFASESIGAFRTVSAFTLEDKIIKRFETLCHGHVVKAYKKARWVSLIFGFADSVTIACQALIFFYGSRLLAKGEYGVISFFVCLLASMNAGESAGQGLSFGPNVAQATEAANRILRMRESRLEDEVAGEVAIPDAQDGAKIELRNIKFKYPTRDALVFNGLSLTIEKGQFAAFVGASGSGKTSIISLLERFYDLEGGQILCNSKDIAKTNIFNYRKHLSLVAQEAALLKGTIRENILLGVDIDATSDEKLYQVCRDASIHDFIVSLPEGYDTNIGSRGVSLSGGQKQRMAIARALLRDPNILLLDEATSSLDSESEILVQSAFERAGRGRTMIVVAHRLSTVQNADVIFVLGEGKLLEQGNHAELLRKRGIYWQMCQNQALDR